MSVSALTRRYAKALVELGVEQKAVEAYGSELASVKDVLSKEELFHEAIANDRGRVTAGGGFDEQKAYPTKLGVNGPLMFLSPSLSSSALARSMINGPRSSSIV